MKRLILSLCAISQVVSATELGRLFYSPEQRKAIDENRLLADGVANKESGEVASFQLKGVVRRPSGKSSIWLNEQLLEREPSTTPAAESPDSVSIHTPENGRIRLRVGERWTAGKLDSGVTVTKPR